MIGAISWRLIAERNKEVPVIIIGLIMFYSIASFDVGKEGIYSECDNYCIDKQ